MKRCILLLGSLFLCWQAALAQKTHIDEISIDTRATIHQVWDYTADPTQFQGDYLNLHVKGHLTDKLSFRLRQRLNKVITLEKPFNATDFLYLNWDINDKWSLLVGKYAVLVGGYEIESAPIDVYYYGAFSNQQSVYYSFGPIIGYSPVEGQKISFQICSSPVAEHLPSFNLHWNGQFTSFWKTVWSTNMVQTYAGENGTRWMNWVALGNKFLMGPVFVDIDIINRTAIGQRNFFFSDWTVIGKAIWSIGKWNLCTKVGYEYNDAANVDAEGKSLDPVIAAGTKYFYGGAGVEYFPLGNENLRLHAVYFRDNRQEKHNFDIGITWRFTIYKRDK